MRVIRAWGYGLRRISPHNMPGIAMSNTYAALPVTFSSASTRGSDLPTTERPLVLDGSGVRVAAPAAA